MEMDGKHQIEITATETILYVGDIDNSIGTALSKVRQVAKRGKLTLNCERVTRVHTNCISSWLIGLDELRLVFDVTFDRCSETFADFVKMMPDFTRTLAMRSCYRTLRCKDCNFESTQLFELIDDHPVGDEASCCQKCGSPRQAEFG